MNDRATFSVAELSGKYYGTDILWGNTVIAAVWHHDEDSVPSDRELASGPWASKEEFFESCSDSHWESQQNLDEARNIVAQLNKLHQHQ